MIDDDEWQRGVWRRIDEDDARWWRRMLRWLRLTA